MGKYVCKYILTHEGRNGILDHEDETSVEWQIFHQEANSNSLKYA